MITYLIVKVTGKCNLRCDYCYYMNNLSNPFKVELDFDTIHSVFEKFSAYARNLSIPLVSFSWHGGEPTLVGKEFFKTILYEQSQYFGSDIEVRNLIQTNGTLIDEDWIELFKKYNFAVGVSIDGSSLIHDSHRYYHNLRGSYVDVVHSIGNLVNNNIRFGTLTVLDPSLNGRDVFNHHYQLGIRNMDFCLPVMIHQSFEQQYGTCGVQEFARFMCEVFDAWLDKKDPEVKVPSLVEIIRLLIGGTPTHCRSLNKCHTYITVEPNGNVGICESLKVIEDNSDSFNHVNSGRDDFSDICHTKMNVNKHSFFEIEEAVQQKFFEFGLNKQCNICNQCSIKLICNSGCLLHRYRVGIGFQNPSIFCEYYKTLINHISHRLNQEQLCCY